MRVIINVLSLTHEQGDQAMQFLQGQGIVLEDRYVSQVFDLTPEQWEAVDAFQKASFPYPTVGIAGKIYG